MAPSQCGKRRTKRIRRGIILGRNNRESESGKRHSFWSMRTSITAAGEISSGSDQPPFPPATGLQRQTLAPISFLVPRIAAAWRNWWGFAALGPDCRKVTSVKFTLGCVVGEAGHERGAVRCGALHGLELFRRAAAAREKEMERRNTAGVVGLTLGGAVRVYQLFVSPLLLPSCRFLPSCSVYAAEAIERHGAWRGCILALRRLARCHPWGGSGYDPVPAPGAYDHLRTRAEHQG